jgi:hypothetical protein
MRDILKVHGPMLLLQVRTLWRCGDGLFFKVPPLVSNTLLTMLHSLLKNVLQSVCCKLQEDSGTGRKVHVFSVEKNLMIVAWFLDHSA